MDDRVVESDHRKLADDDRIGGRERDDDHDSQRECVRDDGDENRVLPFATGVDVRLNEHVVGHFTLLGDVRTRFIVVGRLDTSNREMAVMTRIAKDGV